MFCVSLTRLSTMMTFNAVALCFKRFIGACAKLNAGKRYEQPKNREHHASVRAMSEQTDIERQRQRERDSFRQSCIDCRQLGRTPNRWHCHYAAVDLVQWWRSVCWNSIDLSMMTIDSTANVSLLSHRSWFAYWHSMWLFDSAAQTTTEKKKKKKRKQFSNRLWLTGDICTKNALVQGVSSAYKLFLWRIYIVRSPKSSHHRCQRSVAMHSAHSVYSTTCPVWCEDVKTPVLK